MPSAAPPGPSRPPASSAGRAAGATDASTSASPPGAIHALVAGAGAIYRRLEVIAAHGIGVVADLPPPKRERIQEFHDFVAYVERLVPAMLEQYLARAGRGPRIGRVDPTPAAIPASA